MEIKPTVMLWGVLSLSLAACGSATYPEPTSFADPDVIRGFVRIFEGACKKEMEAKPTSERQEIAEMLSYNDMTVEDFCECTGKTIFESFTEDDLDRFMRDSSKYGESVAEYEPWKTRMGRDILRCVTGNWPSKSKAREPTAVPPGFERYQTFSAMDFSDFRAFAMNTETGRWGYTVHSNSPKKAMDRAINRCERTGQECRLYALGDTIVEGMSPEQIAKVAQDYYAAISPLMAKADFAKLLGKRLSSAEILANLSDAVVEVVTFNNQKYRGQWRSNGEMSATSTYQKGSENATEDKGTWSVSDDKLCRQWQQWLGGRYECLVVTKDGSTLRAYDIHGDIIELIDLVGKIQGTQQES